MAHFTLQYILILLLIYTFTLVNAGGGGSIGVNYGRIANNLPSPTKVAALLKSQGFQRVKLYDTDPTVLKSLSNSTIKVTVDLPNELLFAAAKSPAFLSTWVSKNILPFSTLIEAIAVGNEVFVDTHNTTKYLLPAMHNVHKALVKHDLDKNIKVSSPIALTALEKSYPSSSGSFQAKLIEPVMKPMLEFLRKTESFLMVNIYPFFAYEANSDVISLDYALFRNNSGFVDPNNGLKYSSLFDAQLDAVFAAMHSLKYDDVNVVVTETGWPSKGDENEVGANVNNAAAYNGNLVRRILTQGGTPLRPNANLTVYLFGLFNEDKKPGPTSERNYGLFYPNEEKVYNVPFTLEDLKNYKDNQVKIGDTWCVAKSGVGEDKLRAGLAFACGEGGADCRGIQPGGTCQDLESVEGRASFAFNSYYQMKGRGDWNCDFGGAAQVVTQLPKFENCQFPTKH